MTGVAWPIDATSGSPAYTARQGRATAAGLKMFDGVNLAGRQGIRPMGGTPANIVTLSGSTITIGLHAGEVTPGWSALTGTYSVTMTVAETATLTAADATNPRKDIVIGRVYDDGESASGLKIYRAEYLVGTAGPSPSEPSVPQGGIRLATIDVPKVGSGSAVVTNNYTYTVAAGGLLPVRTQAERDALTPGLGQEVYRVDKKWTERWDGSGWRVYPQVVSVAATSEITHPVAGQVVWHTVTKKYWGYDGTSWIAEKINLQQVASASVQTSSTTYVALTGDPAISFTAPLSGAVTVQIKSAINATHDQTISRAAWEMWTGGTPGSGTGVASANDTDSIATRGANPSGGVAYDAEWMGGMNTVTGLTPGATYSVRMVYKVEGSGTGTWARRKIFVSDAAA